MDEKPITTKKQHVPLILKINRKKFLIIVFSAAIVIRLLFSLLYWIDKPVTHDASEYLLLAENLYNGESYGYTEEQLSSGEHHERAPIYPLFILTIFSIFGKSLTSIKIIQSVISALLPLLIYLFTVKLTESEWAGRVAAIILVFYPPLFWGSAEYLSETLFTTIAVSGFLMLVYYRDNTKWISLLFAAFLMVLAAHIKPVLLMTFPLIFFWLWFRKGFSRKTGFIHAVIFTCMTLVFIAPWTARNYVVEKKFILIASEGGITFWTGNNDLAVGDGDMAANPQIKEDNKRLRRENSSASPAELERIYYREALKFIKEKPVKFVMLLVKKSFYFWFPVGRSMSLFSWRHQLASHLTYFPILFLSIFGIIYLKKTDNFSMIPILSMIGNMIACVIFFPQERYRVPLVDPFLVMYAAFGVQYFLGKNAKYLKRN